MRYINTTYYNWILRRRIIFFFSSVLFVSLLSLFFAFSPERVWDRQQWTVVHRVNRRKCHGIFIWLYTGMWPCFCCGFFSLLLQKYETYTMSIEHGILKCNNSNAMNQPHDVSLKSSTPSFKMHIYFECKINDESISC